MTAQHSFDAPSILDLTEQEEVVGTSAAPKPVTAPPAQRSDTPQQPDLANASLPDVANFKPHPNNDPRLHYLSVEQAAAYLNTMEIKALNGLQANFNIELKEVNGKLVVTGTVSAKTWFFANIQDKSARETEPDKEVVFEITNNLKHLAGLGYNIDNLENRELSATEVLGTLIQFADELSQGSGDTPEEQTDAPVRSGQRIQRMIEPNLGTMKGLGIVAKPQVYDNNEGVKSFRSATDRELDLMFATKKLSAEEEREIENLSITKERSALVGPNQAEVFRLATERVGAMNENIEAHEHRLGVTKDKYRVRLVHGEIEGRRRDEHGNKLENLEDKKIGNRILNRIRKAFGTRPPDGLPVFDKNGINYHINYLGAVLQAMGGHVHNWKDGGFLKKTMWSIIRCRHVFGNGVVLKQPATAQSKGMSAMKDVISGFFGIKFEKYKMSDPNNKVDRYGYEFVPQRDSRGDIKYGKDKQPQVKGYVNAVTDPRLEYRTLHRVWNWVKSVPGFFFDGAGASKMTRYFEFQKDDDINRLQVDIGKQVSGLFRWRRIQRKIHYWNMFENRGFLELLVGAHWTDSMKSSYLKTLDLGNKFATEHFKVGKKNFWMHSPYLRALITACNGNKPKQSRFGYREPGMIFLNIHFIKWHSVRFYNANFFNANISICKIKNSIINGGFSNAFFSYCDIGDRIWNRIFQFSRGFPWFGQHRTLLGFGDDQGGAENVGFRNTIVRRGTVFEGSIATGDFRHDSFSMNRFQANIYEMDGFGVKIPDAYAPSWRFGGLFYDPDLENLDPALKKGPTDKPEKRSIKHSLYIRWYRMRQYSGADHIDFIQEDMDRHYADGSIIADDERMLWIDAMQLIPNGMYGRTQRIMMTGADPDKDNPIFNRGLIEIWVDDDVISNHTLRGHFGQASSRALEKNFGEIPGKVLTRDKNQTVFRQFINIKRYMAHPVGRERKRAA